MMNFCKKSFICIYNKILLDIAFEIRCAESSPHNPMIPKAPGEKRKRRWRPYSLEATLLIYRSVNDSTSLLRINGKWSGFTIDELRMTNSTFAALRADVFNER